MDAMNMIKLTDINGNDITAQQAYDAAMSGPVYALMDAMAEGINSVELFVSLNINAVIRENENVISISFVGISERTIYHFYAGQNLNNI